MNLVFDAHGQQNATKAADCKSNEQQSLALHQADDMQLEDRKAGKRVVSTGQAEDNAACVSLSLCVSPNWQQLEKGGLSMDLEPCAFFLQLLFALGEIALQLLLPSRGTQKFWDFHQGNGWGKEFSFPWAATSILNGAPPPQHFQKWVEL